MGIGHNFLNGCLLQGALSKTPVPHLGVSVFVLLDSGRGSVG